MTKKNLSNLHLKVNDEMGFTLNSKHQLLAQLNITTAHLPEEESPKPCFHPIYTPSGQLISEYRPDDHRWHTGLFLAGFMSTTQIIGAVPGTYPKTTNMCLCQIATESKNMTNLLL